VKLQILDEFLQLTSLYPFAKATVIFGQFESPEDVYLYSEENTITINPGQVLEKDFRFWKCTSY